MLAQLAMCLPVVRQTLDEAQQLLQDKLPRPPAHYIYPPSVFSSEEEEQIRQALEATDVAQPAIGAISLAAARLFADLGIAADMFGGHSYGELVALWAADAITSDELLMLSHLRGDLIRQATEQGNQGGMLAVEGNPKQVAQLAKGLAGVSVANYNAPDQTVYTGTSPSLKQLLERAGEHELRARILPVACAFHSPLVEGANRPLAEKLAEIAFRTPSREVYSNVTAAPYPNDPAAICELLASHLISPVRFVEQIEAMYAAGARSFVELGPGSILTGLTGRVLAGRPHLALAVDARGRDGIEQLTRVLGQLFVRGVVCRPEKLFESRRIRNWDLAHLVEQGGKDAFSPSTWLVNGVRSRPHDAPEPDLIGTRRHLRPALRCRPPPLLTASLLPSSH